MIRVLANSAIYRVMRRTISRTALACLYSTGQFLDTAGLNDNKAPSLIQRFLDLLWYVDDLRNRYAFVPAANEAIKDLRKIERVAFLAICIQVVDLGLMFDLTFAPERGDWAHVRMHCAIYEAAVTVEALYIARPVIPIHPY